MSPSRQPPSSPANRVLVVDDDLELCELISLRLEAQGMQVTSVPTGQQALELVESGKVEAMVLDLRLGDVDGLEVLAQARERIPELPVVILTAHGTIETAVEAMRRGAYGFLTKPFQDHELVQKLVHALERTTLQREVDDLRRIVAGVPRERLIGRSPAITQVRAHIARVAPSDATVLVLGESGTGKELAARLLHGLSRRAHGPFVAVNCGALPPELLESELFGHVKGAFTGATQSREGLFGAARGGTLFLDEVGEAPPGVQVKLLRVLQERRYTRVGSNTEEEADVRVVAATNRELREEVEVRRFREDLFYRLCVVPTSCCAGTGCRPRTSRTRAMGAESRGTHAASFPSGETTATTWRAGTCTPTVTFTAVTTPPMGATSGDSIFIASSTTSTSPRVTVAPTSVFTRMMRPSIGARRRPSLARSCSEGGRKETSRMWRVTPSSEHHRVPPARRYRTARRLPATSISARSAAMERRESATQVSAMRTSYSVGATGRTDARNSEAPSFRTTGTGRA